MREFSKIEDGGSLLKCVERTALRLIRHACLAHADGLWDKKGVTYRDDGTETDNFP